MTDDLRELYQELILDHSKRPHNFHADENANHKALGHNPLCGDKISLFLSVDEKGVITNATFQGSGCAISMASTSIMTDMIKGKTISEAQHLFEQVHSACTGKGTPTQETDDDSACKINALAGVKDYPIRVKCATLAWHTMQSALKNENKASTE